MTSDRDRDIARGKFEGEVLARLAAIEEKLDKGLGDLEIRIRMLEYWKFRVIGAGAVLGFLAGYGSKFL